MARNATADSGSLIFKSGLFAILAGFAFLIFNQFTGNTTGGESPNPKRVKIPDSATDSSQTRTNAEPSATIPTQILPETDGELVHHTYFSLSYSEDDEQASWVAYHLTRARLNENWAERPNTFRPDPAVRTESATPRDYSASGYDKGHLCPAADMAFNENAIDETFLMSNISPQVPGFNKGIWRELEELTRDWARRFGQLYVVTGPMLRQEALGQIGFSKVTIPSYYFKVLYAPDQQRAIAFMLPNTVSERPVMDYAYTIDAVEKSSGIDFFPQILKGLNEELEGSLDKNAWPINRQRYEKRLKSWNLQKQ
ncbi:MAG: DNA/RNA non-specific endonuclease [Saprospiraceae bacterium]